MAINKGYLTAKTDKESDEAYTPKYAVLPLVKYLTAYRINHRQKNLTIWCPFDTEDSNYVQIFKQEGFNVIATHIDNGQNFFTYEPKQKYDIIISNPPFSIKDAIIQRLTELGKPFIILLPLPSLQGQKRFPYFKKLNDTLGLQLIIFDKRINFFKNKETKEIQKGVSFASVYICAGFIDKGLNKNIIYEKLENTDE